MENWFRGSPGCFKGIRVYIVVGVVGVTMVLMSSSLSHCKKNQSSSPNQTDNSMRNTKISNHAYKNSEKIQMIFIDKLIINRQLNGSRQTHRKKYYIE